MAADPRHEPRRARRRRPATGRWDWSGALIGAMIGLLIAVVVAMRWPQLWGDTEFGVVLTLLAFTLVGFVLAGLRALPRWLGQLF